MRPLLGLLWKRVSLFCINQSLRELSGTGYFDTDRRPGDPLAKAISGRVVTEAPMDLPALNQIRTWIKECDPTHDTCSSKTKDSTNLPTRVLAVGQPGCQTVRLVETGGKRGAYLALSHCWGKARNLTTTTVTLELRKKGIHLADLPATIQDAVLVTRELGFAYIWIDTLCILQDSLEDWKVEAAKMADVYSNAYLTITASSSDGDEKGFLWPRQKQSRVCLPNIDSRKPPFFLQHLTKQHMTKPLRDDMSEEPLTNRGWCIQERYLSRRSLFFCHDQLRWECRRLTASECGTSSSQIDFRINNLYGTALSDNAYKDAAGKDSMGGDLRYKGWYDLVAKYMGCSLTYQSDKLPAIGGLAKALAAISKDEYYAGLWGESIVTGLLWSRSTLRLLEGQDPYRAPSWSWASVAGEIEFSLLALSDRYRIRHYNDLWESVVPSVQLNGEDAYGAVRGGQITITAPLYNVQKFIPGQSSRPKNGRQAVFAIDGSLLAIPCVIDTVEEPGLDAHVTILFLAYRNLTSNPGTNKIRSERAYLSRPWNDYFGLVLRAVEKGADEVREVWTRIGMVNGYASLGGKEEVDDKNR